MEKEQLIQVLTMYKRALADAMEEKFIFQALVDKQAQQIQNLEEQLQNLMKQLNEKGDQ